MSAALPDLVHADHAVTAHVQVRDGLGRATKQFDGDAADVAALLKVVRSPDLLDPNHLAVVEAPALADRVVAGNIAKKLPVTPSVTYTHQIYRVDGQDYILPPVKDFKNESRHPIESLEGLFAGSAQ